MNREDLKTIVRGAYDLQKLRIQMGNRIVGNFKAKLGQEPGHKEDEIDADGKLILANLRRAHKKLTDGVKTFPRHGFPSKLHTSDQIGKGSRHPSFCRCARIDAQ